MRFRQCRILREECLWNTRRRKVIFWKRSPIWTERTAGQEVLGWSVTGMMKKKKWKRTGVISIRFGFSGGIWRFLS